jgi:sortase A
VVLRWLERLLLSLGLAFLLIYVGAQIHAAIMYRASLWSFASVQSDPSHAKEQTEQTSASGVDFTLWSGKRVSAYKRALAARLGTPLAVLSVRRLRLDVPVFNGSDEITLNRGAGRILGTAMPGEQGNIGIAGHRDGFFRGLKDVQVGDQIELAVQQHKFVYTVDDIKVVEPHDASVLQPRTRPSLTLVTCYPFYFIGAAPQRYIVQASLTNWEPQLSEAGAQFSDIHHKEKNNELKK